MRCNTDVTVCIVRSSNPSTRLVPLVSHPSPLHVYPSFPDSRACVHSIPPVPNAHAAFGTCPASQPAVNLLETFAACNAATSKTQCAAAGQDCVWDSIYDGCFLSYTTTSKVFFGANSAAYAEELSCKKYSQDKSKCLGAAFNFLLDASASSTQGNGTSAATNTGTASSGGSAAKSAAAGRADMALGGALVMGVVTAAAMLGL